MRTIGLIVKNLIVAKILVLFSDGFHNTVRNYGWHHTDMGRGVSIATTCFLSIFQAITFSPRTSSSEDKHQSLRPDSMAARDLAVGTTFLLQTIFGILGNFCILYHYFLLYCTGCRLRTIDFIVRNVITANIFVLFSTGSHSEKFWVAPHGQFFPYVRAVGRGMSIGTTCLLSVFQAIRSVPGPPVILCWILNMLVNVIYPMYMSRILRNKSITNRKSFRHCSAVCHDQTRDALYAALLSFPDVLCFVLMILASGSTVFILYRHKQRVQNIHRISVSSVSSLESRATKTVLL
ncbi:hypothetical protein EI555_018642, partial [Monodon monoceros]